MDVLPSMNKHCNGFIVGGVGRLCLLVYVVAAMARFSAAEDLQTKDGKLFRNVTIAGMDEGRVKVIHQAGLSWIEKANLPSEFATTHKITPADPAKLAFEKAESEARRSKALADAASKKKEQERIKQRLAESRRIRGRVFQVTEEGVIVESNQLRSVASSLGSIGGGGGVYSPPDANGKGRPKEEIGTFLLVNHPGRASLADGDSVDVDAGPGGTFTYITVLGASATVKKFEVLRTFK